MESIELILQYWLRFAVNLAVISCLITGLYWRRKPKRNYAIAMIVGGMLVYVVIQLLIKAEIGLGVGFGIFAIFSLLRFRTVAISLRDMTYLFATITLSLVNALLMFYGEWQQLVAVNLALLATMAALEFGQFMRYRSSLRLSYDNLDLLQPQRRLDLFEDIRQRAGIKPVRVTVNQVNLRNQSARLQVWYYAEGD